MPRFVSRLDLDVPRSHLWSWHERPGAFERLSPPWQRVELVQRTNGIGEGERLIMKLGSKPFRITWEALHGPMVPGSSFEDTQVRGPFRKWHHVHRFEGDDARSSLIDEVEWDAPLGRLGRFFAGWAIKRELIRLFRFRHARTRLDLERQTSLCVSRNTWDGNACDVAVSVAPAPTSANASGPCSTGPTAPAAALRGHDLPFHLTRTLPMDTTNAPTTSNRPLKIAVTGASGLVGQALLPYFTTAGHEVFRFVRRAARDPGEILWDPIGNVLDPDSIEGLDAIVHLAGDSIADGRWSADKKALIRDSRVLGTKTLVDALARVRQKPAVLVSASAVGFYGIDGDEPVERDEQDGPGEDFLASVCEDWEQEAIRAEALGMRVVRTRLGIILDPRGGVLGKLVKPFKAGLGGKVGNGRQWMSWVALDDVVHALDFVLRNEGVSGAVNVASPNPVIQADFARTLGRVLSRPSFIPLPAFAVKALFGEMGEALLLGGQRAVPHALEEAGFSFGYKDLEAALRMMLGR